MARRPRLQVSGAAYHVMSRGNRRAIIFEDDLDRLVFLEALASMATRYGVRIYAFCTMGNHYHIVIDTPRDNLSDAMQHFNGMVAQASNRRYERSGHLFEARFRSIVIDGRSYLKRAVRYVVLNPVSAGIVQNPAAWRWSSYRATAGLDSAPPWLYCNWLLWAFRAKTLLEAQSRYRRYVKTPGATLTAIDKGELVFGTSSFKARVQEIARQRIPHGSLPGAHAALNRPPLCEIFADIGSNRMARNTLIRVAHVKHGYRLTEISRFLGLHVGTASAVLRRMSAKPQKRRKRRHRPRYA